MPVFVWHMEYREPISPTGVEEGETRITVQSQIPGKATLTEERFACAKCF